MNKRTLIWIIIGCLVLYLIPNFIYLFNFRGAAISSNPSDWGTYGDFIGGSINPILTIANIIALVYLTYKVSEIEDKRNGETFRNQKSMALNEFRHHAYSDLNNKLSNFQMFPLFFVEARSSYEGIENLLTLFNQFNGYLFKHEAYETGMKQLIETAREIKELSKKLSSQYSATYSLTSLYQSTEHDDLSGIKEYKNKLNMFELFKNNLLSVIQRIILGEEDEMIVINILDLFKSTDDN